MVSLSIKSIVLVSILFMIQIEFKVFCQTQFHINLVVAKDGTGNFSKVSNAVAATPAFNKKRFVIYIKNGVYEENVKIPKIKVNIVFLGDGIGRTTITSNRSNARGWNTYDSATLWRGQAVALRSKSQQSTFYKCSFMGWQDTLNVHEGVQFYRECDIHGTVDFIFGDATVVFQNCNLYLRRPLGLQNNTITAQGSRKHGGNSGISIHNCTITAGPDLVPMKSQVRSYLGRPWKLYSRTVILQSFLDDVIDPAGWLKWKGGFALDTLFYAEYGNRGAGSNTRNRVRWPGHRVITSSVEAMNFTVSSFIKGNEWIPSRGVPFFPGLI